MTAYKRQLPFLAVLETTESLNLMPHSALKKVLFGDYMALSIVFLCVALFVASLSSSFPFPVSPPLSNQLCGTWPPSLSLVLLEMFLFLTLSCYFFPLSLPYKFLSSITTHLCSSRFGLSNISKNSIRAHWMALEI